MTWLGRIFRRERDPETARAGVPPELLAAITAAGVIWRREGDDSNRERAIVIVRTVGRFYFDGRDDAAARIRRVWPDLAAPEARRAATLLGDVVGSRNRVAGRRGGTGPTPWALRW